MSATALRPRFDLRRDLWRVVGVLGALLVLNLGFYLFINLPRLRALGALRARRDGARGELRQASQRGETMRGLLARYDEERARLDDFFSKRLGTQAERMTTIQKEIRAIASEFHIDPESIDYNPAPVEKTDLTQFQITIPLVGGYANLRQFINRIESSQHLFIVDSVELAGSREGGLMLSLTIRLSTYFRSPEGEPGPGRARPKAGPSA